VPGTAEFLAAKTWGLIVTGMAELGSDLLE
jgi:hypothetical protein